MQEKTARNNFIDWLFEKFNPPESRQIELRQNYVDELPPNCDFKHLKHTIESKWKKPSSIPYPYWLKTHIVLKKPSEKWGKLHPEIQKIRADRAFSEANFEACQKAKEETMDVLEKIYGRRPGKERRQPCF